MTKEKWIILSTALILIGGCAGFLATVKSKQRLGNPGLKLVRQPILVEGEKNPVGTNAVALPLKVLGFSSEPRPVTKIEVETLPKDTTFGRRRYVSKDGFWADASVVLMGRDRTSIHKPQICLDGQGWRIEKSERLRIPIARPHRYDLPVMKLTAVGAGHDPSSGQTVKLTAVYVYWFVSENHLTADHRERVWWMAKDLITTGVLQRWAYVAYLSVCIPGREDATFDRMKELIAASVPEFQLVSGPVAAASAPVTAAALK